MARATDGSPALLRLALLAGGAGAAAVFDYLAEEILDALDPRVCHALEDSAVLAVLDPDAVAAVTGFDDPGDLLKRAMAAGLRLHPFLAALDDAGTFDPQVVDPIAARYGHELTGPPLAALLGR